MKFAIFTFILSLCLSGSAEAKDCLFNPQKGQVKHYSFAHFCFMENQEQEIWKDVVGWEGFYMVSSFGRVKSLHKRKQQNPIMVQTISWCNYKMVLLSGGGMKKTSSVHRLVAKAFIPNPQNKPQVNHINGIKGDNMASNLEWATNSENQIHANKKGLRKAPELYNKTKNISIYQYNSQGELVGIFRSVLEAERKNGFISSKILECCNGTRLSSNGFFWSKKEISADFFVGKKANKKTHREVIQYDMDMNEIGRHKTLADAARSVNGNASHLSRCCTGKLKKHRNFIWKFS